MRIVVTGGSGKAGRWVVADLRAGGHDVLNADIVHDGSAHGLCVVTVVARRRAGASLPDSSRAPSDPMVQA